MSEQKQLTPRSPRSYVTSIRLNRRESRILTAAARREGVKLSTYLKSAALAAARSHDAQAIDAGASMGAAHGDADVSVIVYSAAPAGISYGASSPQVELTLDAPEEFVASE